MVAKVVHLRDELPRLAVDKVDKKALAAAAIAIAIATLD
mgnify:CR=1 FL=1|jgi:hypothetical protein